MNYLIITLFLGPLIWRLWSDYRQGVCWAVFFLIALSANPVLLSGGMMPNFSLQRLILIVLLIAAAANHKLFQANHIVPYKWALLLYAAINLLPMIVTIDLMMSVKSYLSFTIEIVLFYFIIGSSVETRKDARQIVFACASALLVVGVLALVERFAQFNPVDSFMPGYVRKPNYVYDTLSTFPHRILLGTAMAMGWPLALAFVQAEKAPRWAWWIGICILILTCYYSFSRGPWIGTIFAGIGMFFFAGAAVRRQILAIVVLIGLALVIRPGVWETLSSSIDDTTNSESFKGQTYEYRWDLWKIAWSKISKSGTKLLFGYGHGSTEVVQFETELSYTSETTTLWSWDNHYAATLFETGIVGLASFVWLHLFFLVKILRSGNRIGEEDRALHAAILVAMGVMLFMMTNVAIFAPQLNYLLWALIAAGLRLGADDLKPDAVDLKEEEYAVTFN